MKFLTSRDNPSYKRLRALAEEARSRREEGATLIDGEHLILAALDAQWPVNRLILREDQIDSALADILVRRAQNAHAQEILVLPPGLFNVLSPVATPTGVMAEIALVAPQPADDGAADVLALAGVQDAGNLGTMLRTALAAGVRQVWLDRQTTQAWSPKALRAGMGAQFGLRIEEGCDLAQRLADCPQTVLVTCLEEGSVSLYQTDLRRPVVWVFGSEGQGVPQALIALARTRIRIPMPGATESLNVGAAAAVCLFEQVRQRLVV